MAKKDWVEFMEAARLLDVSGQAFNYYVKQNMILPVAEERGRRLFDARDLLKFTPPRKRPKEKRAVSEKGSGQKKKELTKEQIRNIRDRLRKGEKQKYLAEEYNMSLRCFSNILAEDARNG